MRVRLGFGQPAVNYLHPETAGEGNSRCLAGPTDAPIRRRTLVLRRLLGRRGPECLEGRARITVEQSIDPE